MRGLQVGGGRHLRPPVATRLVKFDSPKQLYSQNWQTFFCIIVLKINIRSGFQQFTGVIRYADSEYDIVNNIR